MIHKKSFGFYKNFHLYPLRFLLAGLVLYVNSNSEELGNMSIWSPSLCLLGLFLFINCFFFSFFGKIINRYLLRRSGQKNLGLLRRLIHQAVRWIGPTTLFGTRRPLSQNKQLCGSSYVGCPRNIPEVGCVPGFSSHGSLRRLIFPWSLPPPSIGDICRENICVEIDLGQVLTVNWPGYNGKQVESVMTPPPPPKKIKLWFIYPSIQWPLKLGRDISILTI